MDSSYPTSSGAEKFSSNEFLESNEVEVKKSNRIFSPSKFELLSRLLENEDETLSNDTVDKNEDCESFFAGFLRNFSNKFATFKASGAEKDEETIISSTRPNKRHDCDDPDTPPSSPINLPTSNANQSILYTALVAPLSSYFKRNVPGTPPGTPTNDLELEDECEPNESDTSPANDSDHSAKTHNFFDQIVNKLNLFSFKAVSRAKVLASSQETRVLKPSPMYFSEKKETYSDSKSNSGDCKNGELFHLNAQVEDEDEEEDKEMLEIGKNLIANGTSTPPPSPSKFSPPLLTPHGEQDAYDKEEMSKSAFVKVTSLNPFLNKSVDLNKLLDSLSSLKRNQRLCTYSQAVVRNKI